MQEAKVTIEFVKNNNDNVIFDHPDAPFNKESILKQLGNFRERFILHLDVGGPFQIPERSHPTLIMDSFFVSTDCFLVQQYPATVLFASITVESALNHDSRLYEFRQKQPRKWVDLTVENLLEARKVGIDITDLVKNDNTSEFVILRNKVAHGDLSGYYRFVQNKLTHPTDLYDVADIVSFGYTEALFQLKKCFNFIKKWGEASPTIILDDNEEIRFE